MLVLGIGLLCLGLAFVPYVIVPGTGIKEVAKAFVCLVVLFSVMGLVAWISVKAGWLVI